MTEPEQWAVELWHLAHRAYVLKARDSHREGAVDAALTIQRAFEEQTRELREANRRLRNGYADAVSGYDCILAFHGRLSGVGFDRVKDHFFEWVTMPEREGLQAGSHKLATRQDAPVTENSHDQ